MPQELLGAVHREGAAHFRVWAPTAHSVIAVVEHPSPQRIPLQPEAMGYFSACDANLLPGALYRLEIDGTGPWPDPCSRYQPEGPHGPSQLLADEFPWRCNAWPEIDLARQVIYELHIGAFTPEGTFEAAIGKLDHLVSLGIGIIELLPLGECAGRFNWGYDGVNLWAPYHVYGTPQSLKRFIDAAHARGLNVILDVVYNHLGPDGNYLPKFSPGYFSTRHKTDWGDAFNFDGELAHGARDFVIGNVCYWAQEFRFDGFRLDATQAMYDDSSLHIVAQLIERARTAGSPRRIAFIAENEPQRGEHLLEVRDGGLGLDAIWNDDFHHSARVALTGSRDGYYRDYTGRAQELLSAIRHGFLYQGQYYSWQQQPRGSPLRRQDAPRCVQFIQNHDQVGNTFSGDRLPALSHPGRYRAMTALLLLAPQTPLLFMGQEFLSSRRFGFFADHHSQLRPLVHRGRREFLAQFAAYADPAAQECIPDPAAEATFTNSKLDWNEVETHATALALHASLLRLRHADAAARSTHPESPDGATLNEQALALRWWRAGEDRLLIVNLGNHIVSNSIAEPLLAPPRSRCWQLLWSSEDVRYGGNGIASPVDARNYWSIPGNCAILLAAAPDLHSREPKQ